MRLNTAEYVPSLERQLEYMTLVVRVF